MNSHKGEPAKVTGELPVSLNLLSIVNDLTLVYLKAKGFFYFLIGLTWLIFQSPSRTAGIAWIEFLTPQAVGLAWITGGIVSVLAGFYGDERVKRLGFAFLIAVPALLSIYFFVSWVLYIVPGIDAPGYERGLASSASFGAFASSSFIVAKIHSYAQGGSDAASKESR